MNIETGPQLDLIGAIQRRWKVAAWSAGIIFLLVVWLAFALSNEYESYTTLLVEPQAVSDSLVKAGGEEVDLNNRLHLMTSQILARSRLSRIIDDLELYKDESSYMLREEVIDLMRSKIDFVPVLPDLQEGVKARSSEVEITTFQLWFTAHEASTSAIVAQRLADDFIKEHISERVQQTQKSLEFIEAQLQRLSNRMQTVEQQIARVKDENPGRLPVVLFSNHRLLERAIQDERMFQQKLNEARSDVAFWTGQAQMGAEQEDTTDESSGSRQLRMLELRLAEEKAIGRTERHPNIIKLKAEIEQVSEGVERRRIMVEAEAQAMAQTDEDELAGMLEEEGVEEEAIVAETYEQAQALGEMRRAESQVSAALAEIERLQETQYIIQNRIDATPRVAEQLEALEREYAQLHVSLNDFSQRRTEAMVQANLERRQLGEKFRILEAAYQPFEVSWPNRILMIPMGLVVGLALGLGLAVVLEALDSSFYSARDLQKVANIPVLATIPDIVMEIDLLMARQELRRNLRLAAVAVIFTIFASGASYWYVNGLPVWSSGDDETIEGEAAPASEASLRVETEHLASVKSGPAMRS